MIVQAIECYVCQDVIYSRCMHDYRYCSCGTCFVDGGPGYGRFGAPLPEKVKQITVEVVATKMMLYDDWNSLKDDKFGLIEGTYGPKRNKAVAKVLLKR